MLNRCLNEITSNSTENLNLTGADFFENGFGRLCKALQSNTSVQSLDLSFCNLIDSEISELAKVLIMRPGFKKLNIKENLLKNESLATILELIKSGKVDEITFDKNQFDENSTEYQHFKEQLINYKKSSDKEEKRSSFSTQATEQNLSNASTPPSPSLFQPGHPSTPDSSDNSSTNKPGYNNGIK